MTSPTMDSINSKQATFARKDKKQTTIAVLTQDAKHEKTQPFQPKRNQHKKPYIQRYDSFGQDFYNCVGVIKAIWFNTVTGQEEYINYGTAFLVSSLVLVTCTHNIYYEQKRQIAERIIFMPDPNGSNLRNNRQIIAKPNINLKFYPLKKGQSLLNEPNVNQLCLITLSQPIFLTKYIKIGLEIEFQGKDAEIIGYPSKKYVKKTQLPILKPKRKHLFGSITQTLSVVLNHTMKTRVGHSGSPILIKIDQQVVAIGIHTHYGDKGTNKGIYFDIESLNIIKESEKQIQQRNQDLSEVINNNHSLDEYFGSIHKKLVMLQQAQFNQYYNQIVLQQQLLDRKKVKIDKQILKAILHGQQQYRIFT